MTAAACPLRVRGRPRWRSDKSCVLHRCAKIRHWQRREWATNGPMITPAAPPERPPDLPLMPEFEPPTREAWLALVEKVLKGGDFEKRLVSRTADGLAIQPLYTRADASRAPAPPARTALLPRRLGHPPAPCRARSQGSPTRPSWRTWRAAATSLLLQIEAPGPGRPLLRRRGAGDGAQGRVPRMPAPSRSMRARTPWMRPAA